jgi:hypothetical protein
MSLAFASQNLGAIYSATFAAVGATGGALFGVFLLGMFVPFANYVVITKQWKNIHTVNFINKVLFGTYNIPREQL